MPARLHKRTFQLLTLIAAIAAVTPANGEDTFTLSLNFGVFSPENSTAVVRRYMPTLKVLEQSMTAKLNRTVDIRMYIATEKDQGRTLLDQGNVDFASLDDTTYLASKLSNPDLRVIAAQNAINSSRLTPWVARAGMHDSIFIALRDSLFEIRNSKVLTSLQAFGFVQSHDSQYARYAREYKTRHTSTKKNHASIHPLSTMQHAIRTDTSDISTQEPALLGAREFEAPDD